MIPTRITYEWTRQFDRVTGNCDSVQVYTFYWPNGDVTTSENCRNEWLDMAERVKK